MHRHGDGKESVPLLLNKLCSSYAKHDPGIVYNIRLIISFQSQNGYFLVLAITSNFLKLSLNFLSNSSVFISSNVDELSVAEKIRRKLSTEAQATEKLNSFELLYEKLKKRVICVYHRFSIMYFSINIYFRIY